VDKVLITSQRSPSLKPNFAIIYFNFNGLNYQETLDFLFSKLPMFSRIGEAAYKADLNNTIQLLEAIGNPHKNLICIHIAGTNGKGSTSHYLASICMEADLKTGLYTSPHILDFRERIQINGQYIPEQFVIDFTEKMIPIIQKIEPSFFELTVAMAFQYFSEQKLDICIIETGLGGRLDSTNVITPMLSVITNIGLDHQNLLGNTLAEIAYEKAGIIKTMIPVVIGKYQKEVASVFEAKANEVVTSLVYANQLYLMDEYRIDENGLTIIYTDVLKGNQFILETPLFGRYQVDNICTVLAATLALKALKINETHIRLGIKRVIQNTHLMGRYQAVHSSPDVILDVAHNKDGLEHVFQQSLLYPSIKKILIFGMVKDKDRSEVLKLIPDEFELIITQPNIPRALPVEDLAKDLESLGKSFQIQKNISDACQLALSLSGVDDFILITGSFFVVSEAMQYFNNLNPQKLN